MDSGHPLWVGPFARCGRVFAAGTEFHQGTSRRLCFRELRDGAQHRAVAASFSAAAGRGRRAGRDQCRRHPVSMREAAGRCGTVAAGGRRGRCAGVHVRRRLVSVGRQCHRDGPGHPRTGVRAHGRRRSTGGADRPSGGGPVDRRRRATPAGRGSARHRSDGHRLGTAALADHRRPAAAGRHRVPDAERHDRPVGRSRERSDRQRGSRPVGPDDPGGSVAIVRGRFRLPPNRPAAESRFRPAADRDPGAGGRDRLRFQPRDHREGRSARAGFRRTVGPRRATGSGNCGDGQHRVYVERFSVEDLRFGAAGRSEGRERNHRDGAGYAYSRDVGGHRRDRRPLSVDGAGRANEPSPRAPKIECRNAADRDTRCPETETATPFAARRAGFRRLGRSPGRHDTGPNRREALVRGTPGALALGSLLAARGDRSAAADAPRRGGGREGRVPGESPPADRRRKRGRTGEFPSRRPTLHRRFTGRQPGSFPVPAGRFAGLRHPDGSGRRPGIRPLCADHRRTGRPADRTGRIQGFRLSGNRSDGRTDREPAHRSADE